MKALIAAAALLAAIPSAAAASPQDTLRRFVGDWEMELVAHEESFSERAGRGEGVMSCRWGPLQAWVDCEMDSVYDSFGRYVLKIVLYPTADPATLGAFVTNSFGGGRLYLGSVSGRGALVFNDAHHDASLAWSEQRTSYEFRGENEITFHIDVSADGDTYLPHSSGVYRRR